MTPTEQEAKINSIKETLHQDINDNNNQEVSEQTSEKGSEKEFQRPGDQNAIEPTDQFSDTERQAYALGWRPKTNYQGEHFVEADEYVRRQPLFERIDRQKKDIQELKNAVSLTTEYVTKLRKESYDQAVRDLETKRLTAVQLGDTEGFKTVDAQIESVRTQMRSDQIMNRPAQVAPEALDWAEKNKSWYNKNSMENELMMDTAEAADRILAKRANAEGRTLNPKEHLKAVEEAVRAQFPHRFENQRASAPSAVGKSTSQRTEGTNPNSLVAKMTPRQREMGDYFVKHRGPQSDMTLEKYANILKQNGTLGK